MIGWDASREAKRAIDDAMPLLADASSVTVVAVNLQDNPTTDGDVPGADIAVHLARHRVDAESMTIPVSMAH